MSLILVSVAVVGILALLNLIPLNCSIRRKFVSHFVLISLGTGSSQPLVSLTTSLSSNFSLALMGSNFPNESYKAALFETIILLDKFLGTKLSILARSPPCSKNSTFTNLPRQTLPKCSGGTLGSNMSNLVCHLIALISIDTPSVVSFGWGSSPL